MLASCLQGHRRTPGQLASAGTAPTAAPDMPASAPPLTNRLGRVRLCTSPQQAIWPWDESPSKLFFKPAIWDEPIKVQKRKKARKLYACGPSGNINPMF